MEEDVLDAGEVIRAFQDTIDKSIEWNTLADVDFAMWLPCEEDRTFANSQIFTLLGYIYKEQNSCWSYLCADLLKTLRLVDEKTFRLGLPEEFQPFAYVT